MNTKSSCTYNRQQIEFKKSQKKTSQKIGALCRLSRYLNNSQKKVIFNSIINTQFNCCPLVRMKNIKQHDQENTREITQNCIE